jgi:hypothetical protein
MNRGILKISFIVILPIITFIIGYIFGIKQLNKSEVMVTIQNLKEIDNRCASFITLHNEYAEQAKNLRNKINEQLALSRDLYNQKEAAVKSSSIENALVYEVRYRDSLGALVDLEMELITVYDKALKNYKEYVDFLHKQIPFIAARQLSK